MGCDYITWEETVIVFTDASGNLQTFIEKDDLTLKEKYRLHTGKYDPDFDFEEPPHDLELDILLYGKKYLFRNGTWECKLYGKERIMTLCEKNGIFTVL